VIPANPLGGIPGSRQTAEFVGRQGASESQQTTIRTSQRLFPIFANRVASNMLQGLRIELCWGRATLKVD
jgi:hypothetical protein